MSISLSVSNNKHFDCNHVINKMLALGINCRVIQTTSVVDNSIEKGCLITIDPEYYDKKKLKKFWYDFKGSDYQCANLNIPGTFDGCIYNYINCDFCPAIGKKINLL